MEQVLIGTLLVGDEEISHLERSFEVDFQENKQLETDEEMIVPQQQLSEGDKDEVGSGLFQDLLTAGTDKEHDQTTKSEWGSDSTGLQPLGDLTLGEKQRSSS